MSLQFSEFNALRQRQKSTQPSDDSVSPPTTTRPKAETQLKASNTGHLFETLEIQLLTFAFIIFDVAAAIVSMPLSCESNEATHQDSSLFNILDTLMGFTLIYFIMELVALLITFKFKFFTHLGLITDTAIVACCVVYEVQGQNRDVRLLGVIRMWRLLRMISTMVNKKNDEIDIITEKWNIDKEVIQECRLEVARMEDTLKRESESKKRVEVMLRSYKDEVETLNEALKIAAYDIAAAAADQLISDDEDVEGDGEYDDGVQADEVGKAKKSVKVEKVNTTSKKMVVNADGSYDMK